MKQTFTPNDLIRFLYNEVSATERLSMDEALCDNLRLREEFEGLQEAYQQLPKVTFRPSSRTIQDILKYSEKTTLEKHA
ncbi:MAG: hypothetical protein H6573_10975 [Lewinellaceae bacterium]|nr:hypothetical protein [Phaeodactylibacter sp.]MCB0612572.1 hypothetical protein [Phaeodactylibacter sp.]MCB9348014.1 hypothetical protein [Lewinellaceae bacterium]